MAEYPKYIGNYPLEKLKLNDWNPNKMNKENFKSLIRSIKERKFIVPIVANKDGTIINGQHRFLASKECNLKKVPVVLVDMEKDEMKMSTLGLNGIKGENIPLKLAKLLQDLNQRHSLDEIARKIGFGTDEMKDKLELLKIPEGLIEKLKKDAEEQGKEVPTVMNFAVSKEQEKLINEALEMSMGKSKGEKLYYICSAYLKNKPKNGK